MRTFVESFFRQAGSRIRKRGAISEVALSASLHEAFGEERLAATRGFRPGIVHLGFDFLGHRSYRTCK